MSIKTRKRISLTLVACLALTLVVGSFAFFTDKADIDATATAGNLAVGLDESTKSISDQLLLGGESGDITNAAILDNWNPGDMTSFSYTVSNDGNKAIRVEETLTLIVTGTGNNGDFENADGSMFTIVSSDGTTAINPTSANLVGNKWTLIYNLDEFNLSANGETLSEDANVVKAATNGMNAVDATATSTVRTFRLAFNKAATNEYQDAEIEILVHVDAIQYANSADVTANQIAEYNTAGNVEQELTYTDEEGIEVTP